jgi:hypothetical protein
MNITPRTLNDEPKNCCRTVGMTLSTISISFENLLRIRPVGVTSKNAKARCIIFTNNFSWSAVDALYDAYAIKNELEVTKTA